MGWLGKRWERGLSKCRMPRGLGVCQKEKKFWVCVGGGGMKVGEC